jgi:hypothetical protein
MLTINTMKAIQRITILLAVIGVMVPDMVLAQFDTTTRAVTKRGTTAADFLNIPVGVNR